MNMRSADFGLLAEQAPVLVEHVGKRFVHLQALSDVNLALSPGACTVLAGHNGAGKSTLIKLMLGLMRPDSGSLHVLGCKPTSRAAYPLRRHIGYLPETVALYPSLTGAETLAFFARLKGVPTDSCMPLLERVGIADAAQRRVGGYSKGMRQRLALAQALLGAPRLMLLDEPTSGLDPASRGLFYDMLAELRAQGVAILLCTHALAELERHADRVVVLRKGRKVADGTLSDLQHSIHLPVRVRVLLAQGTALPPEPWVRVGDGRYEISCAPQAKLATIAQAYGLQGLLDIEVLAPSLDEIYAQLLAREEGAV